MIRLKNCYRGCTSRITVGLVKRLLKINAKAFKNAVNKAVVGGFAGLVAA